MSTQENHILLQGLKDGDRVIIEKIYGLSYPKVRSWILQNNGSVADAKDVFQEGLISMMIGVKSVQTDFDALLIRICKNKWIDQLRKKSRQEVRLKGIERQQIEEGTDSALIAAEEKKEMYDLYESCYLQLTELCQKLITLLSDGLKADEVASELKMQNANTVYRRKFACMKKWKELIESKMP